MRITTKTKEYYETNPWEAIKISNMAKGSKRKIKKTHGVIKTLLNRIGRRV